VAVGQGAVVDPFAAAVAPVNPILELSGVGATELGDWAMDTMMDPNSVVVGLHLLLHYCQTSNAADVTLMKTMRWQRHHWQLKVMTTSTYEPTALRYFDKDGCLRRLLKVRDDDADDVDDCVRSGGLLYGAEGEDIAEATG
jgi:hypothetical protein